MAKQLAEGDIIKMEGGLTALEQAARENKMDLSSLRVDPTKLPKEVSVQVAKLMAKQKQEYEEKAAKIKKVVPTVVDLKSMSADEQKRILADLQGLLASNKEPVVVAPTAVEVKEVTPVFSFNLPPEEETVTVEAVEPPQADEEIAEPEPVAETATEEPRKPVTCPNCRWDVSVGVADVTDEDKLNWIRSLLGSKPFEKTYKLLGGKIEVTFRTRSVAINDMVTEQLLQEIKDGRIPTYPTNIAVSVNIQRMKKLEMAASLVTITGLNGRLPEMGSTAAEKLYADGINTDATKGKIFNVVGAAHDKLFKGWNEALYGAVYKQCLVFDELCIRLTEALSSSDFWKGIAEQD